jgi:hypothetical protein
VILSVLLKRAQNKWIWCGKSCRELKSRVFDDSDDLLEGMMRCYGIWGISIPFTISTHPFPFYSFKLSLLAEKQLIYRCEALELEGRVNLQLLETLGDIPENLYVSFHNPEAIYRTIAEIENRRRRTILVEMDQVVIDVYSTFGNLYKNIRDNINGQKGEMKSILELANPINGATDSLKHLKKSFFPIIIHSDEWNSPFSREERFAWVKEHVNHTETLFVSRRHQKVLPESSYLIISSYTTTLPIDFTGLVIELGSKEFPSWGEILSFFNSLNVG